MVRSNDFIGVQSIGAEKQGNEATAKETPKLTVFNESKNVDDESALSYTDPEVEAALQRRRKRNAEIMQKKGIDSRPSVRKCPLPLIMNSVGEIIDHDEHLKKNFETHLGTSRSWISHSFKLYPGKYYILADVETFPVSNKKDIYLDPGGENDERPWAELESDDEPVNGTANKIGNSVSLKVPLSKTTIKSTTAQEDRLNGVTANEGIEKKHIISDRSKNYRKREKSGTSRLWFQISSTGNFKARVGNKKSCPGNVADIIVPIDTWPFMSESQSEVASRGLVNFSNSLRSETRSALAALATVARNLKSNSSHE